MWRSGCGKCKIRGTLVTEAVRRLSKVCGEFRGMEVDLEVNVVITLCLRKSAAALEFRRTPRLRGGGLR